MTENPLKVKREKNFSEELVSDIQKETGIETRLARLAHVQRGGSPTCEDRLIATRMGDKAVELLLEGKYNQVVCYRKGQICAEDMEFAFTLDRLVKGKATEEELAKLSPEVRAEMEIRAEEKRNYFKNLYDLSLTVSI